MRQIRPPPLSQHLRHLPEEIEQIRSSRRGPMGRVRWDIYLVILRAIAMFIMAAHGLYFISRAADAAADQLS